MSDSSPCIGAGTGSGAPATDIEGNPRPDPTGSDPDIGAYENSRSEPDTIYISVWPGDTNNNGIVDQADVLPLGTFWHGTGPARVPQSMAWQAHTAQPWVPENAAYADANGSGKVDQADVLPIGSNWHKTHQTPSSEPSGAIAAASGDMSIVCDSPQPAGTDFWVDIQVGSEGTPVENLFGISFVFQYSNTNVIDVMEAQLEYDFLGPESELVYISPMKDDSAGTVSIGVTRKSGNSGVSGYGKIARLKMKFVNSASCGNSSTMTLTDIVANDPDGNIIDLGSEPVTVQVDCGQYAFQRKLDSGWNMVSFSVSKCFYQGTAPTQPPCVEMVDVKDLGFNSLAEWFSSVVSPGDAWQMVIGAEAMDASLDPVFHSLKYMSPCEGYWVKVKQDVDNASLNLDGGLFDPACAIPLSEGWNLVGCHLTEGCYDTATEPDVEWVNDWLKVDAPVAKQVLNSIDGKYSMVIDSEGAYNPALPPAFNSIHYMACGFAYWVKMDRAGNLVYSPDSGGSSVYAAPGLVSGIPVVPSRLSMVAYGSVTCDGRELSEGSRIEVFTQSGVLCGQTTVAHDGSYGMMMVYGNESDTPQVEGARPDEKLRIHVNGQPMENEGEIRWLGDKALLRFDLMLRSRPEVSKLGQNYPNPFNPDTWIPYELKEDNSVVIRIYTANGQLLRTLNLGNKPAGFYTDKDRAAHWDGRNEVGESVSSGVYFYNIQAGDFTATKKMVIAR